MVLKIVRTVWPVMLTYVAIGAPCGMIMGQTGMEPWMVFALSSTFVTGSGQFMICNLWLAGVPAASIVASVAAIVGAVVDVPTAIAAFVCTSLFICLLFSQRLSRGNVVAAVSGAVSVAVCKFLGLANIAVPASVVVGIAIALACDAVFDGRGARDAR